MRYSKALIVATVITFGMFALQGIMFGVSTEYAQSQREVTPAIRSYWQWLPFGDISGGCWYPC